MRQEVAQLDSPPLHVVRSQPTFGIAEPAPGLTRCLQRRHGEEYGTIALEN
jgi:hypothetical protein